MQQNCSDGAANCVFKDKEPNCYVIKLFGDPLDDKIQDGRQDFQNINLKSIY